MDKLQHQAAAALSAMEDVVAAFIASRADGARNDEVARELGLETSFKGGQRNYLTHSVLNRLVERGELVRERRGSRIYYMAP